MFPGSWNPLRGPLGPSWSCSVRFQVLGAFLRFAAKPESPLPTAALPLKTQSLPNKSTSSPLSGSKKCPAPRSNICARAPIKILFYPRKTPSTSSVLFAMAAAKRQKEEERLETNLRSEAPEFVPGSKATRRPATGRTRRIWNRNKTAQQAIDRRIHIMALLLHGSLKQVL